MIELFVVLLLTYVMASSAGRRHRAARVTSIEDVNSTEEEKSSEEVKSSEEEKIGEEVKSLRRDMDLLMQRMDALSARSSGE